MPGMGPRAPAQHAVRLFARHTSLGWRLLNVTMAQSPQRASSGTGGLKRSKMQSAASSGGTRALAPLKKSGRNVCSPSR